MRNGKHAHLVAICGMGMGSLAGMLKEAGFVVSGSDQNVYPPMSTQLENLDIQLKIGYSTENINNNTEMVIIGNTVKKDNPEAQAVLKRGLKYMSLPQALRELFLKKKIPLVIAGTHGKTTTSALVAWILQASGQDPGFLIGGILNNFKSSYRVGQGKFFVVEGDEYDSAFFDKRPKFLHYAPQSAILTSIEFDHGDIYRDIEHIKSAFADFVRLVPPEGILIACADFPHVQDIISSAECKVETYGLTHPADWTAESFSFSQEGTEFTVTYRGHKLNTFRSPLLGRHNIQNALAAIALTYRLGLNVEQIVRGLITFKGVKRRQEVRAVIDGVIVIDDFAHHPTKVRETISAVRVMYPDRRIWAIFEPRTNTSRRRFFQKEYVDSFGEADRIIIAEVFNQDQIPSEERFSSRALVEELRRNGKVAEFIPRADDIVKYVSAQARAGDAILIMSNGGFDSIHEKMISALTLQLLET